MTLCNVRVQIGQQTVSNINDISHYLLRIQAKHGRILIFAVAIVVISHEWIERAQLHPTNAQLFVGVALKAANVRADHRYAEHIKFEHERYRIVQIVPSFKFKEESFI